MQFISPECAFQLFRNSDAKLSLFTQYIIHIEFDKTNEYLGN
jgi:hypothetical protein